MDRHVEAGHGDVTSIIWEGNHPSEDKTFTYNELLAEVKKFANVLKAQGVHKGDRVCIYLQMVPELAIKIMRRILRKIAEGDITNLGDISTLADPTVVDALVEGRR